MRKILSKTTLSKIVLSQKLLSEVLSDLPISPVVVLNAVDNVNIANKTALRLYGTCGDDVGDDALLAVDVNGTSFSISRTILYWR